ncbi:MAG: 5'-methylthioadenosine/adenosylhomocysteine nucleosidase [Bacilli bacterium]|nr:5'-methylthioadenosine/adenosylhomocysteine nucleosidase [Bacilli bacterium]
MLGLIGAMDEEIIKISEIMTIEKTQDIGGLSFFVGKINATQVVLVRSGIGKVNAAITATILINTFKVDQVINIGVCGGVLRNSKPYDIIVSNKQGYSDVDVTSFGYAFGEVPHSPRLFSSDIVMKTKMIELIEYFHYPYNEGVILSGDAFVTNRPDFMRIIADSFSEDDVVGCDMESTSIAQVCTTFKTPYLILRMISDLIGATDQMVTYESVVEQSSIRMAKLIAAYCNKE